MAVKSKSVLRDRQRFSDNRFGFPFFIPRSAVRLVLHFMPFITLSVRFCLIVNMLCIDDGYVPAYLGVLLHSLNAAAASYCEMTETQDHHAVTDPSGMYSEAGYRMVGVVEDTQVRSDAASSLYAFSKSKGQFLKIKETGNTMPYFSAYLKLEGSSHAAPFSFRFDDGGSSTTGIGDTVTEEAGDDAPYYNLNGMRVDRPARGVYVHDGKKVIIK